MPNDTHSQIQWVQTGDPNTVDDTTLRYPGQLGAEMVVKEPGPAGSPSGASYREKRYKYVSTDSTMSVSPFSGAVAWWAEATGYKTTTSPTTLGRGRVAGVYVNAITKGNYGYIQVGGPCVVKFVDAPVAAPTVAGLIVIPSATAAKADCLAAGTAASYPALGRSAGTYDAANTQCIVELDVENGRP